MGFVADKEQPSGKFVADEPAKEGFLKRFAPGFMGPLGPVRAMVESGELIDKAAYKAGEKVTDVTGSPEAGFLANVGVQAIPAFGGGAAAAKLAPMFEAAGKRVMQSAIKPTLKDLNSGKAAKAIQTMLDEGINATMGGVDKLKTQIGALEDEITDAVASSTAKIDKNFVADRLRGLLDKFEKQVNPNADLAAIQKAWTEFIQHPLLAGKSTMPVQQAQEMKKATYKALGDKAYGELKGAEIEAQKTLARGLKEEIGAAHPEVAETLAKQAELVNARKVAIRRALMEGNKDPLSLGTVIGAASQNPLAAAGFFANSNATIKSLLARLLYSGSDAIPRTAGQVAGTTLGASQAQAPSSLQQIYEQNQ